MRYWGPFTAREEIVRLLIEANAKVAVARLVGCPVPPFLKRRAVAPHQVPTGRARRVDETRIRFLVYETRQAEEIRQFPTTALLLLLNRKSTTPAAPRKEAKTRPDSGSCPRSKSYVQLARLYAFEEKIPVKSEGVRWAVV